MMMFSSVPDAVTANYVQFCLRRYHFGNFGVKDAALCGGTIFENVDKMIQMIELDWQASSCSIALEV